MKTDMVLGMKKSYNEGLANHIGPESCVDCGNIVSEVLTRESAGWVLSPGIDLSSGADTLQVRGKQHFINRYGKGYEDTAGSETPCMHGNTMGGNREALRLAFIDCVKGRIENPKGVRL